MRPQCFRFRMAGTMLAVCSVLTIFGCSSSNSLIRDTSVLMRDPGRIVGRPRVESNVARIVALWEPSNGSGIDDKPARGFAGQVLFFGVKGGTGARVRGVVNIYQYDNFDPEQDDESQLLHTFRFEPDAWDEHRNEGTLGHTYNCFVPYMQHHKDQVNCGLRVELIQENGRKVTSEITEIILPSRTAASKAAGLTRGFVRESRLEAAMATSEGVRTSGSGEAAQAERRLESISIPLPKR